MSQTDKYHLQGRILYRHPSTGLPQFGIHLLRSFCNNVLAKNSNCDLAKVW